MDLGGIVILLIAIGAVVSWIFAGIKGYKNAADKGVVIFILNLLIAIGVIFVLWLIIVYPILDCKGFLCGLGEYILWFLSSLLMMLIWPLILIVYFNRRNTTVPTKKTRQNEELLDNEMQ